MAYIRSHDTNRRRNGKPRPTGRMILLCKPFRSSGPLRPAQGE